jgi:hypothetical protein
MAGDLADQRSACSSTLHVIFMMNPRCHRCDPGGFRSRTHCFSLRAPAQIISSTPNAPLQSHTSYLSATCAYHFPSELKLQPSVRLRIRREQLPWCSALGVPSALLEHLYRRGVSTWFGPRSVSRSGMCERRSSEFIFIQDSVDIIIGRFGDAGFLNCLPDRRCPGSR